VARYRWVIHGDADARAAAGGGEMKEPHEANASWMNWVRARLVRWGKHSAARAPNGWYRASSFTHANSGDRAANGEPQAPPDVQEIQELVDRMSAALRMPLIEVYTKTGPLWLKAVKLGVSRDTLRRRVGVAERWIAKELQSNGG
jgi:hypothetical protein